jgi:hypothetical protein
MSSGELFFDARIGRDKQIVDSNRASSTFRLKISESWRNSMRTAESTRPQAELCLFVFSSFVVKCDSVGSETDLPSDRPSH